MRASLPMYARPELDTAYAAFWDQIRGNLADPLLYRDVNLDGDGVGLEYWARGDLVLSQTCGYPYRQDLKDKVHLVGTPDYGLDGCEPGFYRSVIVVQKDAPITSLDELEGAALAFNSTDSQSGYLAPIQFARSKGVNLLPTFQTGAHRASALRVAEGAADCAALDAVTWRDMQRFDAVSKHLKVIANTRPTPGLPFICALQFDPKQIGDAVELALMDLPPETRELLGIVGFVRFSQEDYRAAAFSQSH